MSDSSCRPADIEQTDAAQRQRRFTALNVFAAYTFCAMIWGTTWYVIRVCIGPSGYPVFPAAALRFSISSGLMAVMWLILRKRVPPPPRKIVAWLFLAGALSGCGYGLLYSAETKVSGGVAAVVSAIGPLITAMLAMITRTEKPSKATAVGSLMALLGVAIVFHDRLQVSPEQASAVGLLLLCCLVNGGSNVVMKRRAHDIHALATNTLFFFAASSSLWVAAALTGQFYVPWPASTRTDCRAPLFDVSRNTPHFCRVVLHDEARASLHEHDACMRHAHHRADR